MPSGEGKLQPLCAAGGGIGDHAGEEHFVRDKSTVFVSGLVYGELPLHFDGFSDVVIWEGDHAVDLGIDHDATECGQVNVDRGGAFCIFRRGLFCGVLMAAGGESAEQQGCQQHAK